MTFKEQRKEKALKKITRLAAAVLLPMLLLTACGEEDDGSGGSVYTVIKDNPSNLDPQMAQDSSSLSIIKNIFEGLIELDENGAYRCAAAESYTISEDGLTYTFKLRKGIKWSSPTGFSDELTAEDFVYSFRRLFDPATLSPYTESFMFIKNAEKVYDGILSSTDLGVKAEDEYTLIFKLEYPVSDFLYLLTTPPAMPCNEEFFLSTEGRYGLDERFCVCNGAFMLSEWNYDPYWNENFLTMKRISDNSTSERMTYPKAVNYIITDNKEEYENDSGNDIDCNFYSPSELPKLRNVDYTEYPCASVGITFNPDKEEFMNPSIRYALAAAADIDVYEGETSLGIKPAYGIFPSSVMIMGKSARELISESAKPVFPETEALKAWERGISEIDPTQIEIVSIMVSEKFADAPIVYMITDSWSDVLGFDCGVEIVSAGEYSDRLKSGDYEMALTAVTAESCTASAFLRSFRPYIHDKAEYREIENYIEQAECSTQLSEAVKYYNEAENLIISGAYYIPMFYESRFLVYEENTEDYVYDPFNDSVSFKNVKKYE